VLLMLSHVVSSAPASYKIDVVLQEMAIFSRFNATLNFDIIRKE
jgi:hypothetical protein